MEDNDFSRFQCSPAAAIQYIKDRFGLDAETGDCYNDWYILLVQLADKRRIPVPVYTHHDAPDVDCIVLLTEGPAPARSLVQDYAYALHQSLKADRVLDLTRKAFVPYARQMLLSPQVAWEIEKDSSDLITLRTHDPVIVAMATLCQWGSSDAFLQSWLVDFLVDEVTLTYHDEASCRAALADIEGTQHLLDLLDTINPDLSSVPAEERIAALEAEVALLKAQLYQEG